MDLQAFGEALAQLDRHPPGWHPDEWRGQAFRQIGAFLDQAIRPGAPFDLRTNPNPVWDVVAARLDHALAGVAAASPPGVSRLWQWYNAGVILTTPAGVLGVDVIPMPRHYGWLDTHRLEARLAQVLDGLLVTHRHQDHYDPALVRACLELGKPVAMPAHLAVAWRDYPAAMGIAAAQDLRVAGYAIRARSGWHVWRDAPEERPLVYYEVEVPGSSPMLFSGDADYTRSFDAEAPGRWDAFFIPWRSPNRLYEPGDPAQVGTAQDALALAVERLAPRRLVLEHYAELKHVHEGLGASYDLALDLQRSAGVPTALMFWGESLAWPPA